MPPPTPPLVQICTGCDVPVDVTTEEPLAVLPCPTCGMEMTVKRSFNHFEAQEILGAGGMGTVYRALDPNLNRTVAIKLLRREYSNDHEFVSQFQREAEVTASINHPHVVKVYSAGSDHGMLYIAMELVDKGSLDELMTRQGNIEEAQALDVGIQIAHGLNAALQRGLIHRDIKPGNILFSNSHNAKIVDFGLAALMDEAGTVGGEIWGTPYYVAPEKLDNKPEDARSDIYSLGATLFHAIAGRPPFEADTSSIGTLKRLKSQPVNLQGFSPHISAPTAAITPFGGECENAL
ncbi:MAG: serine/threonine-protein kinase, partial [Verrucomicrobiota bacterium]